jgi:hypothetical protein
MLAIAIDETSLMIRENDLKKGEHGGQYSKMRTIMRGIRGANSEKDQLKPSIYRGQSRNIAHDAGNEQYFKMRTLSDGPFGRQLQTEYVRR